MLPDFTVRPDVLRPTGMPATVEEMRKDRMLFDLDPGCAVLPGVLSPTAQNFRIRGIHDFIVFLFLFFRVAALICFCCVAKIRVGIRARIFSRTFMCATRREKCTVKVRARSVQHARHPTSSDFHRALFSSPSDSNFCSRKVTSMLVTLGLDLVR